MLPRFMPTAESADFIAAKLFELALCFHVKSFRQVHYLLHALVKSSRTKSRSSDQ